MKHIYLLGATGSIGSQTLDIIRQNPDSFSVRTLSTNHRLNELKPLIEEFHPRYVSVGTKEDQLALQSIYPLLPIGFGPEGLIGAATYDANDKESLLVNALVGIAGLVPTVEAIKIGRDVALANKETLVVAGDIINALLKIHHVRLDPIDSEHSAIWQCLQGENPERVQKLIITASGGSFRDLSRNQLTDVTVEDALRHPNWSMGPKITIDSATMMNKGFEVIEAHYLFHIAPDRIETILHRESIVHSMVEFIDHSTIAQLSSHDMRLPISYALFYPNRMDNPVEPVNLSKLGILTFEQIDFKRYPCLLFAYRALETGGNAPAVLNAANEAAVALFLDRKITFLQIESIIEEALQNTKIIQNPTLEQLVLTDQTVKNDIYQRYHAF